MATRTLIATQLGFYKGRRVRPGQEFSFDGEKIPKWALAKEDAVVRSTGTVVKRGDTKPAEAAKAAKAKAAVAQGEDPLV